MPGSEDVPGLRRQLTSSHHGSAGAGGGARRRPAETGAHGQQNPYQQAVRNAPVYVYDFAQNGLPARSQGRGYWRDVGTSTSTTSQHAGGGGGPHLQPLQRPLAHPRSPTAPSGQGRLRGLENSRVGRPQQDSLVSGGCIISGGHVDRSCCLRRCASAPTPEVEPSSSGNHHRPPRPRA